MVCNTEGQPNTDHVKASFFFFKCDSELRAGHPHTWSCLTPYSKLEITLITHFQTQVKHTYAHTHRTLSHTHTHTSHTWRRAIMVFGTDTKNRLLCWSWCIHTETRARRHTHTWRHTRRHTRIHTETHAYTRRHTRGEEPSWSLVRMRRTGCFDVGLDGARHLAHTCRGNGISSAGQYFGIKLSQN